MAQAADQYAPSGTIERGRGGFYRNAADTPYVSDPSGELVKSGPRKGLPKRIAYGSPSGYGKLIENTYNLQKWGERRVLLGIGLQLELIADCARLARLDVDSDEYKTEADRIVVAAKAAAETSLAADRGTHAHALAEDDDEGRDWIERAEAGELLGIPLDAQRALVQAWRDMLTRDGLEVLVTEASCVDDTWHLAGTLDNVARLGKDLRFRKVTGEIVTIPAGTVLVLDKKTGKRRTDRQGVIEYWHGYAVQVASYAQSQCYNTETEQRSAWPWTIDQQHALIAHLDVLGAIEGNPSCELVYVDLEAGREHGGATVTAAKEWSKRKDVFSVAQLVDDNHAASAPVTPTTVEQPAEAASPPAPASADPFAGLTETPVEPARGTLTPRPDLKLLPKPEPVEVAPRIPLVQKQTAIADRRPAPTEGPAANEHDVILLGNLYRQMGDEARNWLVLDVAKVANEHGVGFALKEQPSMRRFHITRALINLADQPDDEFIRALLATALGDMAYFPAIPIGRLVGTLNADEAKAFAAAVDNYIAGLYVPYIDDTTPDHLFRLQLAAEATA